MTEVVVAVGDPVVRERIRYVLRGTADNVSEQYVRQSPGVSGHVGDRRVVVLGSSVGSEDVTPELVEELRRSDSLLSIVLCLTRRDLRVIPLAGLARAGIDRLLVLDAFDTDEDLRREVENRLAHALPEEFNTESDRTERSRGRTLQWWCARNGYRKLRMDALAAHFSLNRKTIYRCVTGLGWPDVQALFRTARLLHAASALARTSATADSISKRLGYGSPSEMQKLVKRCTGRTPIELRESGAIRLARAVWEAHAYE